MKITTDSSMNLEIGELVILSIKSETIHGEIIAINIRAQKDSPDNVFEYEIEVTKRY